MSVDIDNIQLAYLKLKELGFSNLANSVEGYKAFTDKTESMRQGVRTSLRLIIGELEGNYPKEVSYAKILVEIMKIKELIG